MIPKTQAVASVAIAGVLAGCGAGQHQTARSSQRIARASTEAVARHDVASTRSRVSADPPGTPATIGGNLFVVLPDLGSLAYRCDSTGQRVAATLINGPAPDTGATVTVEDDHGVHLRTSTVVTGQTATRSTPFGPYHSLTWRMILTNEPRSLVATVRLRFHLGFIHVQGTTLLDCALRTWNVSGQVIEHDAKWSNPSPWP